MCVCNSNLTAGESRGAANSAAYLTFFLFFSLSRSRSLAAATSLQINNAASDACLQLYNTPAAACLRDCLNINAPLCRYQPFEKHKYGGGGIRRIWAFR